MTDLARRAKGALEAALRRRELERLRERGMQIGEGVLIPPDTIVDLAFCHLISIADSCFFGPEVMLLAHDDLAAPFLRATRIGRIVLHESCHIGARATLLPGIEIGPRTIVGACSVVTESLPPDSVCVGDPARPVSTLARYLDAHRDRLAAAARFPYADYGVVERLSNDDRAALHAALDKGDAYITGGRSEELRGTGGSIRTPTRHHRPIPPEPLPARPGAPEKAEPPRQQDRG